MLDELAVRTVDTLKDTRVAFKAADVIAGPKNLLDNCFPTTPPTTSYDPSKLNSVQIVVQSTDPTLTVQNFTLGTDGTLSHVEDIPLTLTSSSVIGNYTLDRFLFWQPGSQPFVRQVSVNGLGRLLPSTIATENETFFRSSDQGAFSDNGKYVFLNQTGSRPLYQLVYSPDLTPNSPAVADTAVTKGIWVWGTQFHSLVENNGIIQSSIAQLPTNFAFSGPAISRDSGISIPTSTVVSYVMKGNEGIYLAYYVTGLFRYDVAYYHWTGARFDLVGSPYTINTDSNYVSLRMALDPLGKFLYFKYNLSGSDVLKVAQLGTDGGIVNVPAFSPGFANLQSIAVEHRGKYAVLGFFNGTVSALSVCAIRRDGSPDDGTLSTCTPYVASPIGVGLTRVMSVPVR